MHVLQNSTMLHSFYYAFKWGKYSILWEQLRIEKTKHLPQAGGQVVQLRLEVMNGDGQASYVLAGGCACWKPHLRRDPWITWKGRSDLDFLTVVQSLSLRGLWGSMCNQLLQRYGRRGNGVPQLIVVFPCLHNFLLCLEWHLADVLICSPGFVLCSLQQLEWY